MEKICRICRDTCNENIIPLLKVVLNSKELEIEGEKFEYCLGLKVLEIPNYPGICTICEQKLNYLYTFKQKAVNSHYELLGFTSKKNDETKRKSESFSDFDDLENIEDDNDTLVLEIMSEAITESDDSDDEVLHNSITKEEEKKDEIDHFVLEMSVDDNRDFPTENCSNANQNAEEALSSTMFNDNFDVDSDCENNGDNSNSKMLNQLSENEERETSNELEFNEKTPKSSNDIQINGSILRRLLEQKKTPSKNTLKSTDDISQIHCDEELPENLPRKMTRGMRSKIFVKSLKKILDKRIIETYNCDICVQKFYSKQKFEAHMKDHEGLPAFQCNICGKTYKFDCRSYYNDHMKDHQGIPRPYSCELCPKSYHRKSKFQLHLKTHTNEKPFVCEFCGKRFRANGALKIHLLTHSENLNYKCDICNKAFRTRSTMRTHRKEIHLPKPFSCKICNKEFGRKCYYETHIIRHRRLEDKESEKNEGPFICIACGKEFNDNDALKVHESKTHLPSNICFKCKGCGKTFNKIKCYQNHTSHCGIDKEGTDFLYECKTCEKWFNDYDALKAHESKPHPSKRSRSFCKLCGKYLNDKLSYKKHSLNCKIVKEKTEYLSEDLSENLSEYLYECKTCGKKFMKIFHYLNHIEKSHNLECDICHKTYSAIHTLYTHFREMHQPKRFSCDKCNMKFGRKFSYKIHMKKNHTHEEFETSDHVEKT